MTTPVTDPTSTSATAAAAAAAAATAAAKAKASSSTVSAQTFLKLLTTQLQNQDPLNPMDNAQMTSQMAQINMVEGINTLNTNVTSMSGQFSQMQALQSAALVGHEVIMAGNKLAVDSTTGAGVGGFQIDAAATDVVVNVMNSAGKIIDTKDFGKVDAGRQSFSFDTSKYASTTDLSFEVKATSGTTAMEATALMTDTVNSVSANGSSLTLQLAKSGTVPYSDILNFN